MQEKRKNMQVSKPQGKPYAGGTKFFQHKARLLYVTSNEAEELLVADYAVCHAKKRQIEGWRDFQYGKVIVVSVLDKKYKNCKKRRVS